jgi:glutamate 5-kinase
MSTKIIAARLGTSAGVTTIITRSSTPGNILSIVRYLQPSKSASSVSLNLLATSGKVEGKPAPPLHTRFLASSDPIRDRHFWLLHTPNPHGTLFIDEGAHKALLTKAGLLPVGVVDVEGNFAQQEVVRLVVVNRRSTPGPDGKRWDGLGLEIGRALVNYAAPEISRIMSHQSTEIRGILGYADSEYVAHRSHISIFRAGESRSATPTRELR